MSERVKEAASQGLSTIDKLRMLLDEVGRAAVAAIVGVQPSGEPFNAIEFDPRTNRPFNPMVNAGAIAVSARLREALGAAAFDQVLRMLGQAAGRELRLDECVFRSELATGHRNRAIGHLLRNAGVFEIEVDAALDLYFRQCSVLATARDLAMMGATLANIGTHPGTGAEVFGVAAVRDTLSVMFTCGMYDGAGDWACRVGLPAKSGVGGGMLAVVNRQLGIGTFSPRLDAMGNSIRGLKACIGLAEEFGLLGCLVLLGLYLAAISRGMLITANAPTMFARLLAGAITLTFFTYAFVNIGMVSGILPVVGLPLPFVSYGGTALASICLGFGILMSINSHRKLVQT